jgi:hypothetical protein
MWEYRQSTGELTSPAGVIIGLGYSGRDAGLNDPRAQNIHDVGPIPQGEWQFGRFFDDHGGKGPLVAHLTPEEGTETFGRSGFMIHGDNHAMNHTASHGCIILGRTLREALVGSSDRALRVVA